MGVQNNHIGKPTDIVFKRNALSLCKVYLATNVRIGPTAIRVFYLCL